MTLSHETLKKIIVASLVVYACMGVFERAARHGLEMYPVFSWFLFAEIPNARQEAYDLRIHALGNLTYEVPLRFADTRFLFEELRQSPTEYTQVIDDFGRAVLRGRLQFAEQHKERLDQMFGDKYARYELLYVVHDPLQYWIDGDYASSTSLGFFEAHL